MEVVKGFSQLFFGIFLLFFWKNLFFSLDIGGQICYNFLSLAVANFGSAYLRIQVPQEKNRFLSLPFSESLTVEFSGLFHLFLFIPFDFTSEPFFEAEVFVFFIKCSFVSFHPVFHPDVEHFFFMFVEFCEVFHFSFLFLFTLLLYHAIPVCQHFLINFLIKFISAKTLWKFKLSQVAR